MFREALDYPTRPPYGGRAVLVGGSLLVLVGALGAVGAVDTALAPASLLVLLPWLAVRGYYVRVLRTTAGHEFPTPPPFRGGGVDRLLADGLKAVLVAGAYLLPGVAVLAPLGYARARDVDLAALLLDGGVPSVLADAAVAVAGLAALLAVFCLIGAAYVLPVAVTNFAYTGRLRAAFELRTVVSGAATEDYVVAWLVTVLLQALVLPAAYLLKALLVGFYLQFLVGVGVRYCYGQGVGAALGLDPLKPDLGDLESGSGDRGTPTPAVRPLEESEVPQLRSFRSEPGAGPDSEPAGDESSERRRRERSGEG